MSQTASPEAHPADLFTPVQVGPLALPHRIVMAPLTRNRAAPGGVPQKMNAEYYRQRAGAALIISEATMVSPQAQGYPLVPGIYSGVQIEAWSRVTRAVHDAGGRIFLQLWHTGRISHPWLQPNGEPPVAPTAIRPAGDAVTAKGPQPFVTPRALATEELPGIIEQFRRAASNAHDAGFDGVEIHAANGYLLDQFLRGGTNRRSDGYGGSADHRARLLLEVVEAVVGVWGAGHVSVRLSPVNPFNDIRDRDPQRTFERVTELLNRFDLAFLHVVEIGDSDPAFDFGALRRRFHGLYMANGGYDFERASTAIRDGAADLVSFGVTFLANPDLPARFARGAPLNTPDPATFYGGDRAGYTDYPALDAESAQPSWNSR